MSESEPETPDTSDLLAAPSDLAVRLDGIDEDDPKLIDALRRLSNRFRGEVGHHISLVVDETIYLSGTGARGLLLPATPIVSTPTVRIDGKTVPATDYEIGRTAGILRHRTGWPDGLENIEITYTHGYSQIPGDIADAILEMAEAFFNMTAGIEQVTSGSESVKIANSLINGGATSSWSNAVAKYTRGGNTDRS